MRAVWLAALLAGCAAPPPPVAVAPPIPAEWRSCPPTPPAVPLPPRPRTFDAAIAWGRATDERRAETAHALEVCRWRLERVVREAES